MTDKAQAREREEFQIHKEFNRFRGHYAGFVEALDLPQRTEHALISQMKSFSYDVEKEIVALHVGD